MGHDHLLEIRLLEKSARHDFIIARHRSSGGELLEMRLLDSHLLDTFGSKSIARHGIDKLLESSKSWLNWIRAVDSATYKLKKSIFFL
jgi:hypothetical protein